MAYAYSNHGRSWRCFNPEWQLDPGEILFDDVPTQDELDRAFPEAPQLRFTDLQAQQISLIEAAYGAAVTEPVTFATAGGVTQTFQADLNSQMILVKSQQGFAIAGAVPQGFYWVAADNTQVPFTLADLKGLYGAMLAQGWLAFQHLQTLKATIRAATTAAAVSSTTW